MTVPTMPRRQLSLFDSICITVGIIIGSGIYETTPLIAANVSGAGALFLVWTLGAAISLAGALCYAELITHYPEEGGDYVFLNRAFGGEWGFLFAWAQFWVVRPGSIGAMAYVFAQYANRLLPLDAATAYPHTVYACGAIALLTLLNATGARQGKYTQNILSVAKVAGLLALFAVAAWATLSASEPLGQHPPAATTNAAPPSFGLAMILVLFAYGGWSEIALVAAEVREPRKNILPALILGLATVAVVYLLTNAAFLMVLGFDGVRQPGVAANTLERVLGPSGGKAMSLLICVSALGAVAGQIFAGARIFYAFGREHRGFSALGVWNARLDTPLRSLLAQAAITLLLAVLFGTPLWNRLLGRTNNLAAEGSQAFEQLVYFTTPAVWFFYLMVGMALFRLRRTSRDSAGMASVPTQPENGSTECTATPAANAFRVPGYPFTPIVFCLSSAALLQSSLTHAFSNRSYEAFWSLGILGVGLVLAYFSRRQMNNLPISSIEIDD